MSKFDQPLSANSPLRKARTVQKTYANGLSRRAFLQMSFAGFAAASLARFGLQGTQAKDAAAPRNYAYQGDTLPNGVAAGETTQTSTMLWTHSTAPGTVTFEYATAADFNMVLGTLTAEVTEAMLPVKVEVSGLTADTDYFYRVTDAAGGIGLGAFRTPAEVGKFTGLHFAVSGDWRQELVPYPSISNVAEKDLDFFVGLGDTVYADFPSPDMPRACETLEDFRIKHNEGYGYRFGVNHWAGIRSKMSFIPTIDDHELRNDFAGGAEPSYDDRFAGYSGQFVNETEIYKSAIQAFQEYNPIKAETWGETGDPATANKPKLYRYFTYGSDASLIVLDNRSFRSAPLAGFSDLNNKLKIFQFLAETYIPDRTMLGAPQLAALETDLKAAHEAGITWKFVIMPEPIQNLGLVAAEDRFESYNVERGAILKFIAQSGITNVVFISADIHGTIVNDITYQDQALGQAFPTGSFEITTGSVGFDAPFGPTVMDLGHRLGIFDDEQVRTYINGDAAVKETFMVTVVNTQAAALKYPLVGLDDNEQIDAQLISGSWTATNSFGWSEFTVDAETQQLRVVTYGIQPYTQADIQADPEGILARKPEVLQEFVVNPKGLKSLVISQQLC